MESAANEARKIFATICAERSISADDPRGEGFFLSSPGSAQIPLHGEVWYLSWNDVERVNFHNRLYLDLLCAVRGFLAQHPLTTAPLPNWKAWTIGLITVDVRRGIDNSLICREVDLRPHRIEGDDPFSTLAPISSLAVRNNPVELPIVGGSKTGMDNVGLRRITAFNGLTVSGDDCTPLHL